MLPHTITLEVVTPERRVVSETVDAVVLPERGRFTLEELATRSNEELLEQLRESRPGVEPQQIDYYRLTPPGRGDTLSLVDR